MFSYDDEPEGYWANCDKCDTLMDYSSALERFKCPCCGIEIAEEDVEEDSDTPIACQACGGPYPYCMTSCHMYDD